MTYSLVIACDDRPGIKCSCTMFIRNRIHHNDKYPSFSAKQMRGGGSRRHENPVPGTRWDSLHKRHESHGAAEIRAAARGTTFSTPLFAHNPFAHNPILSRGGPGKVANSGAPATGPNSSVTALAAWSMAECA